MPATSIPDADRDAVKAHVARYYAKMARTFQDDSIVPPWDEDKSLTAALERRAFPLAEIRVAEVEGVRHIVGHAAVFDQPSDPMWFGREIVAPGAFADSLSASADVRALFNHDPNCVLGRTRAGTLSLSEDDRGLAVDCIPPDTQWARDLMVSMQRGDITQMSFGFQTKEQRIGGTVDDPVRTILRADLFDVSVVTFPAYPQTDAQVRALIQRDLDEFRQAQGSLPAGGQELRRRRLELLARQ